MSDEMSQEIPVGWNEELLELINLFIISTLAVKFLHKKQEFCEKGTCLIPARPG